jgi:hypothetical protein
MDHVSAVQVFRSIEVLLPAVVWGDPGVCLDASMAIVRRFAESWLVIGPGEEAEPPCIVLPGGKLPASGPFVEASFADSEPSRSWSRCLVDASYPTDPSAREDLVAAWSKAIGCRLDPSIIAIVASAGSGSGVRASLRAVSLLGGRVSVEEAREIVVFSSKPDRSILSASFGRWRELAGMLLDGERPAAVVSPLRRSAIAAMAGDESLAKSLGFRFGFRRIADAVKARAPAMLSAAEFAESLGPGSGAGERAAAALAVYTLSEAS